MTGERRTLFLGVGAGAATFKAVALASLLARHGLRVRVLMTEASLDFVAPLSFQAVTGEDVVAGSTVVGPGGGAAHLETAAAAAFVVVPATADLIARIAHGHASDAVSLGALSAADPRLFCPAMNDRMWDNHFVQENVRRLESAGWRRLGPVRGRLAEGYEAEGRMSEPDEIAAAVLDLLGLGGG